MQVILKEDVKGLGYKFDVVKVRPGYGRNFLIPRGLAAVANDSNVKHLEEIKRQAAFKLEKIKNDAVALSDKIEALTLVIQAKVGEAGKLFGSVSTIQVAEALAAKGIEVDRRKITIGEVKTIGSYEAHADLHREVKAKIKIEVVAAEK